MVIILKKNNTVKQLYVCATLYWELYEMGVDKVFGRMHISYGNTRPFYSRM